MYVILLGAPGAGKGTQVGNVADQLGLMQISTGDLFRKAAAEGTELGDMAQNYMKEGKLVPDDVTINMVMDQMNSEDGKHGAVFDGFPRSLQQAKALDQALQKLNKQIDRVIYIEVPETELIERLSGRWICRVCQTPYHVKNSPPRTPGKCDKCGGELYQRHDDTAETVRKRLEVYFKETMPLIEYYKKTGKLYRVDGEGEVEKISERILDVVKK